MIWLLAGVVVFALAMMVHSRTSTPPRAAVDPVENDPVGEDQLVLLQRYGTAADAERLIAEGHGDELAGLGYRPD